MTMLGHLRGVEVGYKYSDNWLMSTMDLQAGLGVSVRLVQGFGRGGGGGEGSLGFRVEGLGRFLVVMRIGVYKLRKQPSQNRKLKP